MRDYQQDAYYKAFVASVYVVGVVLFLAFFRGCR